MRRRTSPVQQWVDSLPPPSGVGTIVRQQSVPVQSEPPPIPECTVEKAYSEKENYISHSNMTVSTPISVPNSPAIAHPGRNVTRLARDPSFQSDSSHCSSVESLLELRRADPEAVLLSLGFGGCASSPQDGGPLSRIPKRFLQPSRLKGIAIDEFVKHQQETSESLDSTSLGYRGLTGSPYVAPSEIVQKIMQRLREHETHELDAYNAAYAGGELLPHQQEGRLSVLSPDNRQYLERPRSKSPDMRNKRMIIGQRSFAFGHDGDLIEINPRQPSQDSDDVFGYSDEAKPRPTTHVDDERTSSPSHSRSRTLSSSSSDSDDDDDGDCSAEKSKPSLVEMKRDRSKDNYRDSTETVIPARTADKDYNHNEPKRTSSSSSHSNTNSNKEGSRRASEGSYEKASKTSLLEQEEGRRFSDGVMHSMRKSEARGSTSSSTSSTSSRKKSLKRQAKIRDTEDHIAVLEEDDDGQEKCCSHCGKSDKEFEEEDDTGESCCYRMTSQNCWREMEKVLQKNKKLEDVVNKSRREMAEIRDMLSSVLSVRMEPGF